MTQFGFPLQPPVGTQSARHDHADKRHKPTPGMPGQIELPDQLSGAIERLVQNGWLQTEQELIRLALVEFIHRHQAELTEQFQREDIAWALAQASSNQSQV